MSDEQVSRTAAGNTNAVTPYVSPSESPPEATIKAVGAGILFGILFGAANAYLGLRAGLTISTSIPVAVMTVFGPGDFFNMGPQLAQWFAYSLVVAAFAAYVATRTLTVGADYLEVFRIVGTVAFACYAMALPQRSIWWKQGWGSTLRSMADGFVYASLTAGAFGWLWP